MVDVDTIRRIRRALDDADPAVRAQAVDALSALGDLAGLLEALGAADVYLRLRAARSLRSAPGWRVTRRLIEASRDPAERVREAALESLAARRSGCCLTACALRRAVGEDASPRVRHAAVVAIAGLAAPWADGVLATVARDDGEARVREAAAALLGRRRSRWGGAGSKPDPARGGSHPEGSWEG